MSICCFSNRGLQNPEFCFVIDDFFFPYFQFDSKI